MTRRFEGKVAIVTGAARGIGKATAVRLAGEGASVLAVDVLDRELEDAVRDHATALEPMVCDVSGDTAPQAIFERCLSRFGRVDFLVNNAGIGGAKSVADTTDTEYDRFLSVDLRSVFRLSREALAHMPRPGGRIVNITSVFGLVGFPGSSSYGIAKAGVAQLTRQMAADYARHGILVNAVAPGVIRTPLTEERIDRNPWYRRAMIDTTPIGRIGSGEDIAGVVAFLCSEDAGFIAGEVIAVDGGWTATRYCPPQ